VKYKVCDKFVYMCDEHKLKNGDEDRADVLYAIVPRLFSVQDCLCVQTLRTVRYRARNNALRTEVNKEV
jgi:hypothetical protein